jgi:peptidyl-tRNA hydrolase, PTH1 family
MRVRGYVLTKTRLHISMQFMIILFALGNNDAQYLHTKHNIGRQVLEKWALLQGIHSFAQKGKYFFAQSQTDPDTQISWIFPTGYMNTSGEAIADFCHYFKLQKNQNHTLIVLQDDSDMIEGAWKFVQGGRSGGHKGIDSIHKNILSMPVDPDHIWRLKIGIRPPQNTLKSEAFVLSQLSKTDDMTISTLAKTCNNAMHNLTLPTLDGFQMQINSTKTDTASKL